MSIARQRNVGAWLREFIGIIAAAATGLVSGIAVDRKGDLSCSVITQIGAATGSPTSFIVTTTVEDSADGSTDWQIIATSNDLLVDNSIGKLDVDLSSARKFIRISAVPVFVGGTVPTIDIAANGVISGANEYPAT